MKIFVNKPLKNSKNLPEIIKSIKNTENNHKNSYFDLGRNPMEIVHGPFHFKSLNLIGKTATSYKTKLFLNHHTTLFFYSKLLIKVVRVRTRK